MAVGSPSVPDGALAASVVVASWRRPRELTRCLEALIALAGPADEIIAVIRRDDSESRVSVMEIQRSASALRLVEVKSAGVVKAMSAGLAVARNSIVGFTDDDAVPRATWLSDAAKHFENDPRLGGVGGRDWIHVGRSTNDGEAKRVGTIQWFGRVVGNHHLGVGGVRDVQILKGVNMTYRRDALEEVGFDELLWGDASQPHHELRLCLELRRRGWRLLYDPEVAVDHYLAPRPRDARGATLGRSTEDVAAAAHNQLYGLLSGLRGWRRVTAALFQITVGSREDPGLVLCAERVLLGREGRAAISRCRAASRGRRAAFRTFWLLRRRETTAAPRRGT